MSDKKYIDLPVLTTPQVADDTKLVAFGLSITGQLFTGTVAQLKAVFAVQDLIYTALGSEGTTLTIPALAGMKILSITREGLGMYEVVSAPDSVSYVWDSVNITLGLGVSMAGERFRIHYRYL